MRNMKNKTKGATEKSGDEQDLHSCHPHSSATVATPTTARATTIAARRHGCCPHRFPTIFATAATTSAAQPTTNQQNFPQNSTIPRTKLTAVPHERVAILLKRAAIPPTTGSNSSYNGQHFISNSSISPAPPRTAPSP